jgi:hypothetical protein
MIPDIIRECIFGSARHYSWTFKYSINPILR